MGMAELQPHLGTKKGVLTFRYEPNVDEDYEEIHCSICSMTRCEYVMIAKGAGRTLWVGFHERCMSRHMDVPKAP